MNYYYANIPINPSTIDDEIMSASFSADIYYVRTDEVSGGNRDVTISVNRNLQQSEESELDAIIAAHVP